MEPVISGLTLWRGVGDGTVHDPEFNLITAIQTKEIGRLFTVCDFMGGLARCAGTARESAGGIFCMHQVSCCEW
jgi:hypothetical protein